MKGDSFGLWWHLVGSVSFMLLCHLQWLISSWQDMTVGRFINTKYISISRLISINWWASVPVDSNSAVGKDKEWYSMYAALHNMTWYAHAHTHTCHTTLFIIAKLTYSAGVFIARGKEDALVTRNLVPGDAVYGEKRISIDVRVCVCMCCYHVEFNIVKHVVCTLLSVCLVCCMSCMCVRLFVCVYICLYVWFGWLPESQIHIVSLWPHYGPYLWYIIHWSQSSSLTTFITSGRQWNSLGHILVYNFGMLYTFILGRRRNKDWVSSVESIS